MKILVASPYPDALLETLKGHELFVTTEKPDMWPKKLDWIVCYGYRHIIREPQLTQYKNKIINLHIGLLPWNRGSNPNFWSWFDGTPQGVTIHYVDAGLDTGDIIAQEQVIFPPNVTLATSYLHLQETIERLFEKTWPDLKDGKLEPTKQPLGGTGHITGETHEWLQHLPLRWDTPTWMVSSLGAAVRSALTPNSTETRTVH